MNHIRARAYTVLIAGIQLVLTCAAPIVVASQLGGHEDDFIYKARPRDTLIGLGRRFLREPRRWRDVQRLNDIGNARRIPLGSDIKIPYAWLRMDIQTARAADVSGTVLRDGKPLTAGTIIPQGSLIETGPNGSVTLAFADGSVVTLQKSSRLRLQTLQQVSGEKSARDMQLKLEKGRIRTAVKPHGGMGRFEIETPVAISAVRGTQFRTAFVPATRAAADETLEGTVSVSGSRSAVPVSGGFGTRVESDGVPLPPVRLLSAPDLSGISATNLTPELRLAWPPIAGAVRYRVQLAPDPDFHTVLTDAASTDAHVSLPAPADGVFWVRVRAIDRLGLEGLDATKAMTEHRLPPPPAPTSPQPGARVIGTHASFSWSSSASAGARYRWRLARSTGSSVPVMEREIDGKNEIAIDGIQPGRYIWRIAAMNAAGEAGEWSAPQPYVQRPDPPALQAPEIRRHTVELRWTGAAAARYHLQLSRNPGFARPLVDRDVDASQLSVPRLHAGTYYARVQIIASDGTRDPYGAPRSFEVPVPRWVRIVLPVAAAALAIGLTL